MTKPLIQSIRRESELSTTEIEAEQNQARKSVHLRNKQTNDSKAVEIMKALPETTQQAVALAQEKGAGAWLNTLPIKEHGFTLHKGAFRDALAL